MTKTISIINGPNLNMLGKRESNFYGNKTLQEIYQECQNEAYTFNLEVEFFTSNHEGEIIEFLHSIDLKNSAGVGLNLGGYTHTSIAIRDSLLILQNSEIKIPMCEIHLSNIYKRETFRHKSLISDIVDGVICGLGVHSYLSAIRYFCKI